MTLSGTTDTLTWEPGSGGKCAWQYLHHFLSSQEVEAQTVTDVEFEVTTDGVRVQQPVLKGEMSDISVYHTSMLARDPQRIQAYRSGINRQCSSL